MDQSERTTQGNIDLKTSLSLLLSLSPFTRFFRRCRVVRVENCFGKSSSIIHFIVVNLRLGYLKTSGKISNIWTKAKLRIALWSILALRKFGLENLGWKYSVYYHLQVCLQLHSIFVIVAVPWLHLIAQLVPFRNSLPVWKSKYFFSTIISYASAKNLALPWYF